VTLIVEMVGSREWCFEGARSSSGPRPVWDALVGQALMKL